MGEGWRRRLGGGARTFAYETLGWDGVISLIHVDNAPSIGVAEKLGAVFDHVVTFRGANCAIYRHPPAQIPLSTSQLSH